MIKDNYDLRWTVVTSKKKWMDWNLGDVWTFRDLYFLFIRRDIVSIYKQTILGPLWFILEPLATTLVFTFLFGKLAQISTGGVPHVVFYLSGTILWNFFSGGMNSVGQTFLQNSGLFGKVYFPRILVPLATVSASLVKLGIQFILFLVFIFYFIYTGQIKVNYFYLPYFPVIVLQTMLLGLSTGLIISSLTAKYRDLFQLIGFANTLWMYATPIVYTLNEISEKNKVYYYLNPFTAVVENMRFIFFDTGSFDLMMIGSSWMIILFLSVVSLLLFNRTSKSFIDTV